MNSILDANVRDASLTLREALLVNNRTLAVASLSAAEQAQVSGTSTNADADTITFNIGAGGVQTIAPTSALPLITDPVTIDGATQPGFAGSPIIELNGAGAGFGNGLSIIAGNSTVRGLVINRFFGAGIAIQSIGNNRVEGCFVGTDVTGTLDRGNTGFGSNGTGLFISGANDNVIGGTAPGAGSVISGNDSGGIRVIFAMRNQILGNRVGTNAAGTAVVPNTGDGILFNSASNNTVGGTTAAARNIVSGNINGIHLLVSSQNNVVIGNYVGTDVTGTVDLGNRGYGVALETLGVNGTRIGGATPDERNLISGNDLNGVFVNSHGNSVLGNYIGTDVTGSAPLGNSGAGVRHNFGFNTLIIGNVISANRADGVSFNGQYTGSRVQGNRIGTDAAGTADLGNRLWGVGVGGASPTDTDLLIGGTAAGEGNIIAYNDRAGVAVSHQDARGVAILGNSIFANDGLGIDLFLTGVTPNDVGDADAQANLQQNFPVLTTVSSSGDSTTIQGTLNSTANTMFRLEFFSNVVSDPTGFGEGQTYLGFTEVTTDAGGNVAFTATVSGSVSSAHFVTATATRLVDHDANPATALAPRETSEFSQGKSPVLSNNPPTADAGPDQTSNEGATVSFDGGGSSDPDGNPLAYSWSFGDGATAIGATPTHVFVDDGTYTVTLTVSDGRGGTSSDTMIATVNNVAPTAGNDSATTNEDQAVTVAVLANNSDPAGALDPLRIDSVTNGTKGTTSIDTKGTADTTDDEIIYTPSRGATGSDSFTYTISDGDGGTATGAVTVQIRNLVDVSGRVFDDRDNDGLYEPGDGEVGIGGVTVQLLNQTSGAVLATQTTAADGTYTFDVNLGAGSYKIVAAQPAGYLDGKETAGNLGGTVDNSQDSDQITGIGVGAPGTTADALDYLFGDIRASQALGLVWQDSNNDGEVNFGERAIAGVAVELTGLDDRGHAVSGSAVTDSNGIYSFIDLRPSNAAGYTLRELQPAGFVDGLDALGQVNGVAVGSGSVNDAFSGVVMSRPASIAENYNFGERPPSDGAVTGGQTATIGFWQNKNGQSLINALNGGSTATQLGNWLADTFTSIYGAGAGANNLAGKTNAQVAAFYKTLFARTAQTAAGGGSPKMDAQVMATAFAVYVTNQTLAGTTATAYGFLVTANGVGTRLFNVGNNGAAFGVANNSQVSVLDLLLTVNSRSRTGLLYDLDGDGDANDSLETSYRTMANNVFSGINEAGDI